LQSRSRGEHRGGTCVYTKLWAALSEKTSWQRCPELKFEGSGLSETDEKGFPFSGSAASYPQGHLLPPRPREAETLDTKQENVVEIFSLRQGAIDSAHGDWPRQGEAGRIMREGSMQNPGQERAVSGTFSEPREKAILFVSTCWIWTIPSREVQ